MTFLIIFVFTVYVNFNGLNPITISIDTNAAYDFGRQWNLRIQQIECDAPWRGK